MSEESEFETNQQHAERRYQERLDYENMLKMQVMNVTNALTTGRDGIDATDVLLVMLIPELMEPIKAEVEEAENILRNKIKTVNQQYARKENEGFDVIWARDARAKEQNRELKIAYRTYAKTILKLVMEVLNDSGMLLSQERRLDEGGY